MLDAVRDRGAVDYGRRHSECPVGPLPYLAGMGEYEQMPIPALAAMCDGMGATDWSVGEPECQEPAVCVSESQLVFELECPVQPVSSVTQSWQAACPALDMRTS